MKLSFGIWPRASAEHAGRGFRPSVLGGPLRPRSTLVLFTAGVRWRRRESSTTNPTNIKNKTNVSLGGARVPRSCHAH